MVWKNSSIFIGFTLVDGLLSYDISNCDYVLRNKKFLATSYAWRLLLQMLT